MRVAGIVIALVMVAACRETQHCASDDESYQGGRCQTMAGRDGGPRDGGPDASADGGHDSGVDGGPCAPCSAAGQQCLAFDVDTGLAADAGACVDCYADDHCAMWFMQQTDAGVDAGHPPGIGICESFVCAAGCRDDGDCGGNACVANHCSAFTRLTQAQCRPCDATENCTAGLDCVQMTFGPGHTALGGYCLVPTPSVGACPTPYTVPVAGHCGVNQMLTTCDAVREFSMMACTIGTNGPCGRDDIPDDGVCANVTGAGVTCTYACDPGDPTTCVATRPCGAVSNVCGGT
jgi:hypothetical protein